MEFKISSALKDHIGKELITDDNVAILELVKNSYDAGATRVGIVFEDMRSDNPKIYIADNGNGMSRKDLEDKWLFVGYSEKKNFEKNLNSKDKKARIMAGAKGIGRFSCDRLGIKLRISTKTVSDKDFNVLDLNWNEFENDQKKEFQSIPVKISTTKNLTKYFSFIKRAGTIVEITKIRSSWDREKLLKLKRYLQRLINPLQVPEGDNFQIFLEAKDFVVQDNKESYDYDKINGVVINKVYETLGVKTTTIDCEISEDGKSIKTSLNDKGIKIFELTGEENKNFPFLKNINVKISFLNTEAKKTFKRLMGTDATEYGNLFLFKNGFRILPYGERQDDWLNLNDRKTQGHSRFLGTREILGRVEINGNQGEFREVTSRAGGLIETNSFVQLRRFIISFVLPRLEKYVVGAIDWDSPRIGNEEGRKDFDLVKKDSLRIIEQIAGSLENKNLYYNRDFLEIVEKKTIEKIPETIKNIENIAKKEKDNEVRELYSQQIRSLKQGLRLQKETQEKELKVKEKETLFLSKALSTDKEALINLNHTIQNSTWAIRNIIGDINEMIRENKPLAEIAKLIDEVSIENEKILVLSEFVTLANFNLKVEWIKKDIVTYIKEYIEKIFTSRAGGIVFSFINDNIIFFTRFRPLEISILLDNFITNSKKAGANAITLKFIRDNKKLRVLIGDNGKGINAKSTKHLFNRGFTTTGGSGIGLHHIRSILSSMGGKVSFVGNDIDELGKGACFEVILK